MSNNGSHVILMSNLGVWLKIVQGIGIHLFENDKYIPGCWFYDHLFS